jgi:DNA recombination protein RmuC
MGEHFAKLGRALETAGNAYDSVVGSYERSVLPSSRRLAELKVVDQVIEAPKALDLHTRSMRTIESGPDAIGSDVEPSVDDVDHEDAETDS